MAKRTDRHLKIAITLGLILAGGGPIASASAQCEISKLLPSDGMPYDYLGRAVAIDESHPDPGPAQVHGYHWLGAIHAFTSASLRNARTVAGALYEAPLLKPLRRIDNPCAWSAPLRLLVRPSPVPDFGEILPVFGDILFVLDELVADGLLGIRRGST